MLLKKKAITTTTTTTTTTSRPPATQQPKLALPPTSAAAKIIAGGMKWLNIKSDDGSMQAAISYRRGQGISVLFYELAENGGYRVFADLNLRGTAQQALKKYEWFFFNVGKDLRKRVYAWIKEL